MPHTDVDGYKPWPTFVPLACLALVTVNVVGALTQRRYDGYDPRMGIVAAALIIGPFLTDLIVHWSKSGDLFARVSLVWFSIPVVAGVMYLLLHSTEFDVIPFVLVFLCGEVVSRSRGQTTSAIVTGLMCVGALVAARLFGAWTSGSEVWIGGITFAWFGGFLIRELETGKHELMTAQAGLAEKAAADERSRIAREVHDVIAHSLSVTMLHVTAARMSLEQDGGTAAALDALREAEQQGRQSLTEVRRTVGLLGPQEAATAPPMPTMVDLDALVDSFKDAGLDIDARIDAVRDIPPAVGMNVYRIVQESLTNVAKHAPTSKATVRVRADGRELLVDVHNAPINGVRNTDGLGLRGMSERAATIGGTLTTSAAEGWTVSLAVPLP